MFLIIINYIHNGIKRNKQKKVRRKKKKLLTLEGITRKKCPKENVKIQFRVFISYIFNVMLETRKLFTNVMYVDARGVCALSVAPRGSASRRAAAALLCAMVTYGSYVVAQRGRKSRRGGQKHKRGASLSTTAPRLGNKPTESSRLAWS